jgi:hypothetical protein
MFSRRRLLGCTNSTALNLSNSTSYQSRKWCFRH